MNNIDIKTAHRFFTPCDFEQEQEYLQKMSRQGWHFAQVKKSGLYIFIKGKPQNYIYRLDYKKDNDDMDDYTGIYKDSGWDYIFSISGLYNGAWHYFRKEAIQGETPEIFTDNESKIELYKRIRITWTLFFVSLILCNIPVWSLCIIRAYDRYPSEMCIPIVLISILYLFILALYGRMFIKLSYMIKRLTKRIKHA